MVLGQDSCSKGHVFESRHSKLDGHSFTFIFCLRIDKNNRNRGLGLPIFKKIQFTAIMSRDLVKFSATRWQNHFSIFVILQLSTFAQNL